MCWFCGCYTKIVQRYEPVRDYLDTLEREIELVAAALPWARFGLRHLHWAAVVRRWCAPRTGSGSAPTFAAISTSATEAELAVELDPRDATEAYVAALAAAGVNRASIGVQDFDPTVQRAINRLQPYEVVERVCGWLRCHGIERITSLSHVRPAAPDRRACPPHGGPGGGAGTQSCRPFGYAHVPWMKATRS